MTHHSATNETGNPQQICLTYAKFDLQSVNNPCLAKFGPKIVLTCMTLSYAEIT